MVTRLAWMAHSDLILVLYSTRSDTIVRVRIYIRPRLREAACEQGARCERTGTVVYGPCNSAYAGFRGVRKPRKLEDLELP